MEAWEADFIALWRAGVETAEMARRLGIPVGTVSSRAKRLRDRGLIDARPRGGHYPSLRARQRLHSAPVSPPVQRTATDPVLQPRLDALEQQMAELRQALQALLARQPSTPVVPPVQRTTLPHPSRGKAVRWNLWIPEGLKAQLIAQAAARQLSPSALVQELLWQAVSR
jgi:hypothetical protein